MNTFAFEMYKRDVLGSSKCTSAIVIENVVCVIDQIWNGDRERENSHSFLNDKFIHAVNK